VFIVSNNIYIEIIYINLAPVSADIEIILKLHVLAAILNCEICAKIKSVTNGFIGIIVY